MVCMCACVSVCVFVCSYRQALPYECHSSVSVLPCLTSSFYCVYREPGAHSWISAPSRNPFRSLPFSSDTSAIHISCTGPHHISSTVKSPEIELHPGLAPYPALLSPAGSRILAVSACISAQQILTKGVINLPLSFTLYHIYA